MPPLKLLSMSGRLTVPRRSADSEAVGSFTVCLNQPALKCEVEGTAADQRASSIKGHTYVMHAGKRHHCGSKRSPGKGPMERRSRQPSQGHPKAGQLLSELARVCCHSPCHPQQTLLITRSLAATYLTAAPIRRAADRPCTGCWCLHQFVQDHTATHGTTSHQAAAQRGHAILASF